MGRGYSDEKALLESKMVLVNEQAESSVLM
jgi:hypothetical protein